MLVYDACELRRNVCQRLIPGSGGQGTVAANERCAQAIGIVDVAEVPATTITEPAIIDLVVGARHQAHNAVNTHIDASITANATVVADARHALQLPGTCLEAIA